MAATPATDPPDRPDEWTARHARTRAEPGERVVRFEPPEDDWARRHAATDR